MVPHCRYGLTSKSKNLLVIIYQIIIMINSTTTGLYNLFNSIVFQKLIYSIDNFPNDRYKAINKFKI